MLAVKLVLCGLLAAAAAGPSVVKTREDIDEYKVLLEKYMEDDGLTLEERMAENPKMNAWESSGKFQGDMLLDEDLVEDMVSEYATGGRMAYTRANRRWPNNVVPYEFGINEFNLNQQRHILNAMASIEQTSCIRFRLRNNNDQHWVRVTGRPTGCYASVGWHPNRQIATMNVARANPGQGCLNTVIIIHEWYHVFGFFHMQSTYNRYDYVRIHWENIQNGMAHNFDRYDSSIVSNLRLPYEYGSCMHYGTHFFSSNGRPTLSTTRFYGGVLGQTVRVTGYDIWRLNRHYNCPGAWSDEAFAEARTTIYEPNEEGTLVARVVEPQLLADELEPIDFDDEEQQ